MADRSTPPALRRSEMRDGVKFIIMFTGKKFPAYRIVDAVGLCRRAVGRYLGETIETDVAPVVRERGVADLDARFARLEGLVPLEIGLIVPIRGAVAEQAIRSQFLLNLGREFRPRRIAGEVRSEEHTSELQSLMRSSYAVFCLKKQDQQQQ